MARDTVTVLAPSRDGVGTEWGTGTAINTTNGAQVVCGDSDKLLLRVTNTHGSAHPVTIKAGVQLCEGQGDLESSDIAATTGDVILGPFTSSRFQQADGKIYVDFESGHAGKVYAVRLP